MVKQNFKTQGSGLKTYDYDVIITDGTVIRISILAIDKLTGAEYIKNLLGDKLLKWI